MHPHGSAAPGPVATGPGMAPSLYDQIGGEEALRHLVEVFYDIVEFEPDGEELLALHRRGHGVAHSRIEQFNFLSGFFGGPPSYVTKHGHSDVRYMHEHIEITAETRDAWLRCMSAAIDRVGLQSVKDQLMRPFTKVAFMLHEESLQRQAK